jgi:hypothetical protein
MSNFHGLFGLQNPRDLLAKLTHDFERLRSDPTDQYAAFDFFVTAHHMEDWLYPDSKHRNNKQKRTDIERQFPMLQVCSHIANGSKHFEATAKHHASVVNTRVRSGGFQAGAFQADAFDVGGLVVELDKSVADQLCPGSSTIECLPLARKVLQFWKEHLDSCTNP